MKQTKILMGMPVTVEIIDEGVTLDNIAEIFSYFQLIDKKFSTYKSDSEISQINRGKIHPKEYSHDMQTVFRLSEQTKQETDGYFDIYHNGIYDPSGLVKGWAIYHAAQKIEKYGCTNFFLEAGGDIQVSGKNSAGERWRVGIRDPFDPKEIVKVLTLSSGGIATSGTYVRGQHIYNPHTHQEEITDIISMTVIGPNIYEADRFATAAFAMGKKGIHFIENLPGFAGYMIDSHGIATMTSNFSRYIKNNHETH